MTDLGCCVKNCVHNEDNMCCRGNIKVEGKTAKDSSCTCCGSFQDSSCGCAKNATCCPDSKIEVACDATNCIYNDNLKCSADHIDVRHSKDLIHGQTECATFKM